jgi:hypothetical protein
MPSAITATLLALLLRKVKVISRLLLLAALVVTPASAQSGPDRPPSTQPRRAVGLVTGGFMTGQEFRELSEAEQQGYVMGIVDGMLMAPVFGGGDDATRSTQRFLDCLKGMNSLQLAAVARKHLESYPERWHESMRFLFWQAWLPICPEIGTQP